MKTNNRIVTLDTSAQVRDLACYKRLQIAVASLGFPSRQWPTEMQDFLLRLDMQGIEIWTQPEQVPIPLIDDVWKSERYVRDFLSSPTCRHPDRARWLLLYFKVMKPQIYRHLIR